MRIDVLSFEGCPSGAAALETAKRVADELAPDAVVTCVNVASQEEAQEYRFLGSPSIQIDGLDIEPSRRKETVFALACRVYQASDGFSGTPPEILIRRALTNNLGE